MNREGMISRHFWRSREDMIDDLFAYREGLAYHGCLDGD